jgi:hypothetical protein
MANSGYFKLGCLPIARVRVFRVSRFEPIHLQNCYES